MKTRIVCVLLLSQTQLFCNDAPTNTVPTVETIKKHLIAGTGTAGVATVMGANALLNRAERLSLLKQPGVALRTLGGLYLGFTAVFYGQEVQNYYQEYISSKHGKLHTAAVDIQEAFIEFHKNNPNS